MKNDRTDKSEVLLLRQFFNFLTGMHKSRGQVVRETKFCTIAPNICGSSVCNLLHVIILVASTRVMENLWTPTLILYPRYPISLSSDTF